MFSDYRYRYLQMVCLYWYMHLAVFLLLCTIIIAIDYHRYQSKWAGYESLVSAKSIDINENMRLRCQREAMRAAEIAEVARRSKENSQLGELLLTSSQADMKAIRPYGWILAVRCQQLTANCCFEQGKRDGVFVGQPILDAKGMMGQIVDVGPKASTVLLISDSKVRCSVLK